MVIMGHRLLLFSKLYAEVLWGCWATRLLISVSTTAVLLLYLLCSLRCHTRWHLEGKKNVYRIKRNDKLLLVVFGGKEKRDGHARTRI